MNFREATDAFLAHPRSIGTIARSMERSEASIRAARDGIRKDPPGWENHVAALALVEMARLRGIVRSLLPGEWSAETLAVIDEAFARLRVEPTDVLLEERTRAVEAYDVDYVWRTAPAVADGPFRHQQAQATEGQGDSTGAQLQDLPGSVTHGRNSTGKTGEDTSGEERGQAEVSEGAGEVIVNDSPTLNMRTYSGPVTKESQTKRGKR